MKSAQYLKLYAHCIPVRGYKRSTICDLQREDMYYIPNSMADMLYLLNTTCWEDIRLQFGSDAATLDGYADFLLVNDLAFWTDHPQHFPALDLDWSHPSYISNAIVDIDISTNYHFPTIISKLIAVGCRHLQVRFFRTATCNELEAMLMTLEGTLIRSIEVVVRDSEALTPTFLEELVQNYKRVKSIFIHSAPQVQIFKIIGKDIGYGTNMGNIIFTTQKIQSSHCCGFINALNFSINIQTFTEAQKFNTCLNKKVGIDVEGNIKNCPSAPTVFGNIYEDIDLEKLLVGNPEFEKMWVMAKDQIDICSVCEHRYVCSDCRVFTQDPSNPAAKPARCSYNPMTAEWEGAMKAFNV